ncbi:transcriptional regulator, ArsR family [Micromonospora rhizosphaerae]|uniref:Transcriptional regulator, ArsR family n=1 Tax=Micromonospora rhizosphaerae TaxID=568872 RepID=A0A1C6SYZ6_9ACTN|nr:TIGR03086 family metal-binding protein [Micromonospora rhizosphaerae]SCL34473.1 transcriptional regulator, ArsR family [Micromonospora rhizosphaerae]
MFTKTVVLPVDIDEAFALITEPERLRRWQTVSARVDLRVGGDYRWTITPGHVASGTFREIEPGKRVVFGWGWEGNPDLAPDTSTVSITLEPVADGTQVTLTHEGLTDEQAAMHAEGWNHYLGRLEKAAVAGDAGPDEWSAAPERLDELSAADATLAVLQTVLRQLTSEDRPKQTPCAAFTCHDLAEHLFGSMVAFGSMAGVEVVNPETGSLENRVATMAAQAIEGWRARGLDGAVPVPGGEMPARLAASILPVEFLLHAWDMAQGSGKPVVVSDEVVAYVHKLAEQIVPGARGSSFAEEVTPAMDADPMQRLAAFTGRRPATA